MWPRQRSSPWGAEGTTRQPVLLTSCNAQRTARAFRNAQRMARGIASRPCALAKSSARISARGLCAKRRSARPVKRVSAVALRMETSRHATPMAQASSNPQSVAREKRVGSSCWGTPRVDRRLARATRASASGAMFGHAQEEMSRAPTRTATRRQIKPASWSLAWPRARRSSACQAKSSARRRAASPPYTARGAPRRARSPPTRRRSLRAGRAP